MHQLESQRQECYRTLAKAILGAGAPSADAALARALAEHSGTLRQADNIVSLALRRAA